MLRQQYKHVISCMCTVVGGDRTKQLPVPSHRIPSRYDNSRPLLVSPVSPAIRRTEPPPQNPPPRRPTERTEELILWLFDNAFNTENTGSNCRLIRELPKWKGPGSSQSWPKRSTSPVAARSETWVCSRSLVGVAGSNPAGVMDVCLLWVLCAVRWRSLRGSDHSSRGVLPSVTECEQVQQ